MLKQIGIRTNRFVSGFVFMPRRTSINDVKEFDDLNDLKIIVQDKRLGKRAVAKKERRNRHYVKVLIKSQLSSREGD